MWAAASDIRMDAQRLCDDLEGGLLPRSACSVAVGTGPAMALLAGLRSRVWEQYLPCCLRQPRLPHQGCSLLTRSFRWARRPSKNRGVYWDTRLWPVHAMPCLALPCRIGRSDLHYAASASEATTSLGSGLLLTGCQGGPAKTEPVRRPGREPLQLIGQVPATRPAVTGLRLQSIIQTYRVCALFAIPFCGVVQPSAK